MEVGVRVNVEVGEGVLVKDGVGVKVWVGVSVGVLVSVDVNVGDGVSPMGVIVGLAVAVLGVIHAAVVGVSDGSGKSGGVAEGVIRPSAQM